MTLPERILICGGRLYATRARMNQHLDSLTSSFAPDFCIIITGDSGVDSSVKSWAYARGHPLILFPVNPASRDSRKWKLRNRWMFRYCDPDLVVAFPGGLDFGSLDVVRVARDYGVPAICVDMEKLNERS